MAKTFNLDDEFPAFYSTQKGTFRELLEKSQGYVTKERTLYGKEYYSFYPKPKDNLKSPVSYIVNGRQARKYVNKSTGHLKDL